MRVYYNENDPFAAAWLRELMAYGLIPEGVVDERSIADVQPDDVRGYSQCHFFAGISGWPEALRLAGWGGRPVWTGSCPCQPFSVAGKGQGEKDERHLWPAFARLIRERRPSVVFGEQVEGAVRHGWLDGVFADLEGAGYACGAAVLGAHSVGAPHVRQRLFWVADATGARHAESGQGTSNDDDGAIALSQRKDSLCQFARRRPTGGLADAIGSGIRRGGSGATGVASGGVQGVERERQRVRLDAEPGRDVESLRMVQSIGPRLEGHAGHGNDGSEPGRDGAVAGGSVAAAGDAGRLGDAASGGRRIGGNAPRPGSGGHAEFSGWSGCRVIKCRDGKLRRIPAQSGFQFVADGLSADVDGLRIACEDRFPLAGGKIPNRTGLLKGAGNAIVPQVAAEFVRAFIQSNG